jgi:hypothetical protein
MQSSFQFNYGIFYNYYTNNSNLETDKIKKYTNYYAKTYSKKPKREKLSDKFIWINNTQVHITKIIENGKNALLFTLPPEENSSEMWDDHFHFGIDDNIKTTNPITNQKETVTGVYFHKTVQHPEKGGGKELISCYFLPNLQINRDMKNFEEMKCLQRGYKMNQLYTERDFLYLNEIISRPFPPLSDNKPHHSSNHHANKKHSGNSPRGGTKKKKIHRKHRKTVRRR